MDHRPGRPIHHGRRDPFVISVLGFTIFSFATATAKDLTPIFICRYIGGMFGAGPLTLAGPVNADVFTGQSLGIAPVIFSLTVFIGPMVAQPIDRYIVINASMGWRWT
jgi:DHA1 family multidrug resistance protein-like MFS transporter